MDFSAKFVLAESQSVEDEADAILDEDEDFQTHQATPSHRHFESAIMSSDDDSDDDSYNYGGGRQNIQFESEIMDFNEEDFRGSSHDPMQEKPKASARVNTNQVSLPMKTLLEPPEVIFAGSYPITCQNKTLECGAILSHLDEPEEIPGETTAKYWNCKFCGMKQRVDEWPDVQNNDVLFHDGLPEPPAYRGEEVQTTVFVLDTSGSMAHSMEIAPGSLRGRLAEIASEDQNAAFLMCPDMIGQVVQLPPVRYVTRLQVVKAAVLDSLDRMRPHDKAGLVVFNDKVTVFSDGINTVKELSHPQLVDMDQLEAVREDIKREPLHTLSAAKPRLMEKVKSLTDNGQTALGPALYTGIAVALEAKPSRVVLCTDGKANVGLGGIEDPRQTQENVREFYETVTQECKHLGVSVQVVSFSDCQIGMETVLGSVPVETGGMILQSQHFQPDLSQHFHSIMETPIIATGADIRFVVNQNMFVKVPGQPDTSRSSYTHFMGNLTTGMKQCYAFGFKENGNPAGALQMTQSDASPAPASTPHPPGGDYPFQFQINYTDKGGRNLTRVWTNTKPITTNRAEAEKSVDSKIQTGNFLQTSAAELLNAASAETKRIAKKLTSHCDHLLKQHSKDSVYTQINGFRKCMMKITSSGLDDSVAVYLRNLQSGGLLVS